MIKIQNLSAKIEEEYILKDINLILDFGKIYYINGENGSGKSSLGNILMGNPDLEVVEGEITYDVNKLSKFLNSELKIKNDKIEIQNLEPNERSLLGIFLANQSPIEIPGVSLLNFLRIIYNKRFPKEEQLPVFKFRKILDEKTRIINYPKELLDRNLNEGFSGGERKKTEILQMLLLNPNLVILDEVDSGLDKQSRIDIFNGLKNYFEKRNQGSKNLTYLIISHYSEIQKFLPANEEFLMQNGVLQKIS